MKTKFPKGLNVEIVKQISQIKGEDEWMREKRLQALEHFLTTANPSFGIDLEDIDYNQFTYYRNSIEKASSWEEMNSCARTTFEKEGLIKAEKEHLGGIATQFESEVIYHSMLEEVEKKGVIFKDTDSALKENPELFKRYFGQVVDYKDNKFSALNSAVWSGGSFIYVPPGVKLDRPLQSYFRINSDSMGQFERTLIIVDEGAELHYIEGCSAQSYSSGSLHAAVVEIIVLKGGKCRYTTIQNWATNIINLVTKRALVEEGGVMEWIDGNIGSMKNMKYPCCVLKGDGSRGLCVSIALSKQGQYQDAGAKMIHLGKNTSSQIIAKSIGSGDSLVNYRGVVYIGEDAVNSRSFVQCDTLILDEKTVSDTLPKNILKNNTSIIEHEASVSKISEEQLFYFLTRGIEREKAIEMIVLGFIEPFSRELPLEYAVELNQLMKLKI